MTRLDHSSLAFLNLHLTKGPRRSGPSLVLKAKVSPRLCHYGDELFELECYFSCTSDSSYDEPNSHPVRCWSYDCPHLRLDVGALLKEFSYRAL